MREGSHMSAKSRRKMSLAKRSWNRTATKKEKQYVARRISEGHQRNHSLKGRKITRLWRKRISRTLKGQEVPMKKRKQASKSFWRHQATVSDLARHLRHKGYKVLFCDRQPRPDLIVRRGSKLFAVEVQFKDPTPEKYNNTNFFDDIWWVQKHHRRK